MTGTIEPPCGVPSHRMGRWEDVVLGIWWCSDCGEEIWVTEGVDDEQRLEAPEPQRGGCPRVGEASGNRRGAAAVPGVPGGAADGGNAACAPRDRAPGDGGARIWSLIASTLGGMR